MNIECSLLTAYYEVQLKIAGQHDAWVTLQDYEVKGLVLFDPGERLTQEQAQQRLHTLQAKHPHRCFRVIGPLRHHADHQPIPNECVQ